MTLQPLRPAERRDAAGGSHVDFRAILGLAAPLMANSAIQALLNLTDTWFVGRLSTTATDAMSSIYWVILCAIILLGGVGMAVQTFAAQAFGARRQARASQAAWSGVYASLLTIPVFIAIGFLGAPLLAALHVDAEVTRLALAYWWPRLVVGGPLGLLVWSLTGFFNGVGRTRLTLIVTLVMAVTNVPLNQLCIFTLDMGIAGSAWGTVVAELAGLLVAAAFFLGPTIRTHHRSHLTWRRTAVRRQFQLGLPMGLGITADLAGLAVFQLMLVTTSLVAGATTQIVMMLTSLAYMPGIGIALAGTTLVGQSVGAGERDWARRVGNAIIGLSTGFMGCVGLLLGLASPWLLPGFVNAADPHAAAVVELGSRLIWLAAAYQAFDGLNLGSSFCLRGAGDVRVPAMIIAVLSWGLLLPITHAMVFAPGRGWVDFLPQFDRGAVGGWTVSVGYVVALGVSMWVRWRSGAWRRIRL
ncbi:MAG: MATE family efflux transporter [Pseudomonadota bacterium]